MTATLLFDLDGTLTETDHLHFEAFRHTFAGHGVPLDWDTYRTRIMGKVNPAIAAEFLPHVDAVQHPDIMDRKEANYRSRIGAIESVPGLVDLLDWAHGRGIRCGVVTNAPRANAETVLKALGITERFDAVVIGPELSDAKPHPLPYLRGLDLLGGSAERSVAFEDSPSGIRAALTAGLPVVGLATNLSVTELLAYGASVAAASFADPAVRAFVERHTSGGATSMAHDSGRSPLSNPAPAR